MLLTVSLFYEINKSLVPKIQLHVYCTVVANFLTNALFSKRYPNTYFFFVYLFYICDCPIRRDLNVSKIKQKTNKEINKNKNISFRFSWIESSFTAFLMRAEHNTCKSLVTYADYIMFFVVRRLRFLFTFILCISHFVPVLYDRCGFR